MSKEILKLVYKKSALISENPIYAYLKDDFIHETEPQPIQCIHEKCPECHGTGIKRDGTACIHMISCPCKKCTPTVL